MKEITHFDIKSALKIFTIVIGAVYSVVGLVFYVVFVVNAIFEGGFSFIDFVSFFTVVIFLVLMSVAFWFLFGIIVFWLYNKLAPRFGGIKYEVRDAPAQKIKETVQTDA